jgi:acyl-CoA synthetase (AMP-forming)/AMP-acid ligase II
MAYLRYTSGSTGSAKGAIRTHRHVLHDAMGLINQLHLGSADVLTTLSPVSLGKHLLGPLLCGASFCPLNVQKEGLVLLRIGCEGAHDRLSFLSDGATLFLEQSSRLGSATRFAADSNWKANRFIETTLNLSHAMFPATVFLVNTLSSSETGSVSMFFVDPKPRCRVKECRSVIHCRALTS